jgi:N-acetylglucosamine kinase-like BadF-type ATPase
VLFLGIDGGGSKTAFVLEDENGKELSRCESGPSNWVSAGEEEARRNIASGIEKLKASPGVAGCGFAGAGRPEGVRFYRDCLSQLLPSSQIFVETDAFISYVGAIGLQPGLLLIAGTGSIAIGRRMDGSMIRVGGWGPAFSDEGSGFWIGCEALRYALRASDSAWDPEFVSVVCKALHLTSIYDAVTQWKSGQLSIRAVAGLAPLLFREFPAEPAKQILNEAAEQLQAIAKTAGARIGLADFPRSIAGSIGSQPLMRKLLHEKCGFEFQPPLRSPEHGAIVWARSQAQR